MNILVQVDANKETNVSLHARLGIPLSELNTIVRTGESPKSVMHFVAGSQVKGGG